MKKKDSNSILETSTSLIKVLDDKQSEVTIKAEKIKEVDPFARLRIDLVDFFRQRITEISKQEQLRELIAESFINDLNSEDESLTFQERMSLYRLIASQSGNAINSLLSLFKPTPGAPSVLVENLSKNEAKKDVYEQIFNNTSSKDLEKFDKFSKFIDALTKE